MKKSERIAELERRVRDLEARPTYLPVFIPQYVPPPIYVQPFQPWRPYWITYAPNSPNQCTAGQTNVSYSAGQTNVSYSAGLPQNMAVSNVIEQN